MASPAWPQLCLCAVLLATDALTGAFAAACASATSVSVPSWPSVPVDAGVGVAVTRCCVNDIGNSFVAAFTMQIAGQYWTDGVPNPAWTTHGNYFINSLEAVCSDHTAPEPLTPNAGSSSCPTTPAPSNLLPFFWPAFHVQSPAYGWSSFTMSTNGTWAVDLLGQSANWENPRLTSAQVTYSCPAGQRVVGFKAVPGCRSLENLQMICDYVTPPPSQSLPTQSDPPAGAVGENCGVSVPLYSAIDYTAMKDAALFPPKASCCPPGVFVEFLSWTVTRVQCNDPNGCNGIAVDGYAGTAASPVPQYTVGLISGQCLDGTVLRTVSRYNVLNGDGPVPTTCPVQYDAIDSDVRSYASSPVQYFVASATSSHVVTSMFSANDTDYPCPDGFALSGFQAASACTGITLLEVFCSPLAPPPLPPPSPPPAVYNGVCSPLLQAVPDRSYTEVSRSCCPEGSFISQLEFAVNPGSDSYQPPAYEGVAAFLSGIQGTCSDGTLLQSIGQMQANGCVNRYDYNYTDYEYDIISGTLEYYSLESTTGWNSFEVNDLETTIGAFGFGDTRYHSDETNFSCSQYGAIFVGYGGYTFGCGVSAVQMLCGNPNPPSPPPTMHPPPPAPPQPPLPRPSPPPSPRPSHPPPKAPTASSPPTPPPHPPPRQTAPAPRSAPSPPPLHPSPASHPPPPKPSLPPPMQTPHPPRSPPSQLSPPPRRVLSPPPLHPPSQLPPPVQTPHPPRSPPIQLSPPPRGALSPPPLHPPPHLPPPVQTPHPPRSPPTQLSPPPRRVLTPPPLHPPPQKTLSPPAVQTPPHPPPRRPPPPRRSLSPPPLPRR